ncbi:MAG: response regulator [Pseudomonadota bacterium]
MTQSLADLDILVVEDEFLIAQTISSSMEAAGARNVEFAESLAQAHVVLSEKWFDVAVLDIRLIDGESWDLASALAARGVSVVIYSGHIRAELEKKVPSAVFLPKPATPNQLVDAVVRSRRTQGTIEFEALEEA